MKIILFGGNGFVGTNFLLRSKNTQYHLLYPKKEEVNLFKKDEIINYINKNKPNYVINLAGKVGGIIANKSDNYNFLIENTIINLNLIDACYNCGVKNLLNISSSCIYPKDKNQILMEKDILSSKLEPTNEGYALAKIIGLKMCQFLKTENNLDYKTIIPCNLYGPYDKFGESSHMIPGVIKRVYEAKIKGLAHVKMWGDGSARREFMFVEDFVDFIFFSLKNFKKIPPIMNIGLGYDLSIREYYEEIIKVVGYEGEIRKDLSKPVGMSKKQVDISNQIKLGWKPKFNLADGLEITYKYYTTYEI